MKVRVLFFSLARSDYTSIRPILKAALKDKDINVNFITGGSHLKKKFGNSIDLIKTDGIPICRIINFLNEKKDERIDYTNSFSKAVKLIGQCLKDFRPDKVFILGDRWEMLAVASATSLFSIPIIHHSGGDITQGSADNQFRFAISNLSHIHLTSLNEHRRRLIKIGEEKWRVIWAGEPALSDINITKNSKLDLYKKLKIHHNTKFVLATLHPTSFDSIPLEVQINIFIEVLGEINHQIILTAPNPDIGNKIFLSKLKIAAKKHNNIKLIYNFGSKLYYAAMNQAEYMIGNSSSGLWESPSFKLPVINIGNRQFGRKHCKNVINVPFDKTKIIDGIKKISGNNFIKRCSNVTNPYIRENTIDIIINKIKEPINKEILLSKKFRI